MNSFADIHEVLTIRRQVSTYNHPPTYPPIVRRLTILPSTLQYQVHFLWSVLFKCDPVCDPVCDV
jgi:hypothetical protein